MRGEFAAFKARLIESPTLAGKVYPIVRVTAGEPVRANYVVAKSSPPDQLGDARYGSVQSFDATRRFTFDVRVVTVNDDGLNTLGDEVLRQLVGHRLGVEGRKCDPINLVGGVEEGDGYDRVASLFYRDFSFRFISRRDAT